MSDTVPDTDTTVNETKQLDSGRERHLISKHLNKKYVRWCKVHEIKKSRGGEWKEILEL